MVGRADPYAVSLHVIRYVLGLDGHKAYGCTVRVRG